MSYRRFWMLAGFFAAGAGDWFLAIKGATRASAEFLCGVLCFTLAQVCWSAGQLREARPDWRMALALAIPLVVFSGVRLFPALPHSTGVAVCTYAVLTACSFSLAYATRRAFYAWGKQGILLKLSEKDKEIENMHHEIWRVDPEVPLCV